MIGPTAAVAAPHSKACGAHDTGAHAECDAVIVAKRKRIERGRDHQRQQRKQLLDPRRDLLAEIITPLLAFAHRSAGQRGSSIQEGELILAGQSLGGLAGLAVANAHPGRIGKLIISSPSLWWHPDPAATPADLAGQIRPWIVGKLGPWPRTSVHLSVGLHEGLLVPHVLALKQALCDHGLPESAVRLRVYDGGHDVAWWREELIDALGQVLSTMPPAHLHQERDIRDQK